MLFKKAQPEPTVVLTDHGFVLNGPQPLAVKWNDVMKVVGYKLDRFTTDEILFDLHVDTDVVIVSEEFPGYKEWIKALEENLPGFDRNWWNKVAQPPFATNLTVLFER